MRRSLLALGLLTLAAACAPRVSVRPDPCRECDGIEARVKAAKVGGERLQMPKTSAVFYRTQEYRPAWSTDGCLLPRVDALLAVLKSADLEGLNPVEYHVKAIERLKRKWPSPDRGPADRGLVADMDALLTDAYLLYASHLLGGRTNLDMARAQWSIIRRKADIVDLLATAISSNNVESSLRSLVPPHEGYARLRAALDRYRRLSRAGSWPVIPAGPIIRVDQSDERVPQIRRRLALEALSEPPAVSTTTFDAALADEVRQFQRARGIEADGRIGAGTLAELNVPVEDRINQIKFSLDRWRWLPFDLGRRYIVVNIPEFRLSAYDKGKAALSMPVIVGKNNDETATPVFSHQMTYLEFSPEWNVPKRIAVEEMLPMIQKTTDYLRRNHLEVLVSSRGAWQKIDPNTVQWSSVTAAAFPYRFRQPPGPWNGLGAVKFMFPNEYSVYIHGNAEAGLFDRRLRMFSHGCVRVDEPIVLAKWVLNDPDWTLDRLKHYMGQSKPIHVPLGEPLPVYLLYWTAWVDESGRLNFREDIYGRDREMREKFYPPPAIRREGRTQDGSKRPEG